MPSWEARETYNALLADLESTPEQIGAAGAALVHALQEENREVPDYLLDEIISGVQSVKRVQAIMVEK